MVVFCNNSLGDQEYQYTSQFSIIPSSPGVFSPTHREHLNYTCIDKVVQYTLTITSLKNKWRLIIIVIVLAKRCRTDISVKSGTKYYCKVVKYNCNSGHFLEWCTLRKITWRLSCLSFVIWIQSNYSLFLSNGK